MWCNIQERTIHRLNQIESLSDCSHICSSFASNNQLDKKKNNTKSMRINEKLLRLSDKINENQEKLNGTEEKH